MRIERARVELLDIPFREAVISGAQRWERHRTGIIMLRTEDGQSGLSELPAPGLAPLPADLPVRLAGALQGLELGDASMVEATLRHIDAWPSIGRAARSAAESALVDVLARLAGRSVGSFLLTGSTADVAVNAMLGISPPDETADLAAELVEAGYRCLKLKAGLEPDGALEGRVAAVRARVGPDVALRLDFNGSLSAELAADVLAGLADLDIEYAEQPISPAEGAEALARLRWMGAVPIAADESVSDLGAARVLLDTSAVDALVVKPARVGGLRQAQAIIELATAAAVPVTVSTLFETGVGLAGALHLAATTPGPQAHGLATAALLESDLLRAPLAISGGRMKVPDGPGLGIDLDARAVARYRET